MAGMAEFFKCFLKKEKTFEIFGPSVEFVLFGLEDLARLPRGDLYLGEIGEEFRSTGIFVRQKIICYPIFSRMIGKRIGTLRKGDAPEILAKRHLSEPKDPVLAGRQRVGAKIVINVEKLKSQ